MNEDQMTGPAKYRKKPVVIETWCYEDVAQAHKIVSWINTRRGLSETHYQSASYDTETSSIMIPTMEGIMECRLGSWVICGVVGEFYACDPDVFERTYEKEL